jgi:predicted CXXCH cytochrome family protein
LEFKELTERSSIRCKWGIRGVVFLLSFTLFVPKALSKEKTDASNIQLRPSCVDAECHTTYRESKYVHGPVALKKCNVCHLTVENRHVFTLVYTGEKLCTFCHEMKYKYFIHEPVAKGECIKCHDPHSSDSPFFVKAGRKKELCFDCHQEAGKFQDKKFPHTPVEEEACILCHETHSSWNNKLLIGEGDNQCLLCHKKEFESFLKMKHIHEPVIEGACQRCHDPHGSNYPMLTYKKEPESCYDCHQDIAKVVKHSSHVHGATVIEKSCSNCHSIHASSLPKLLEKPIFDLCLSCHNKTIQNPDGTVLENIAELMEENPFKHGPIQQNNCNACHSPHGSNISRLLISDYPQQFYIPFNVKEYKLCFQCHLKDTFLQERTITLTNFRDGDLNLHFLHVNKKEKGRTCRACHEIHASKQKAHVRLIVPYGKGEFPLEFIADADGGTCVTGCHHDKAYGRKYKRIESLNENTVSR